ncbi:hypothetical protein BRADI_5g03283v3 [Brachypodium distachyon]|uniref:RNase H type-1 domain-containing protein n=1 Tax=Brachypodium distachyon TaxID=15368 RepID=A0A0Q3KPL1_BRADI|nr:hypothetical protein BRADI_5g03283v3 [Brachypodium distachyon]
MVKLNVDAAFNSDDLSGAVAAVIRDEAGHFVAGANERINWCADAHIAETLALKFGLNLALSIGCFRVLGADLAATWEAGRQELRGGDGKRGLRGGSIGP